MVACLIFTFATCCFLGWLLKISFYARLSECRASRLLTYGVLIFYVFAQIVFIYYWVIPVISDVLANGWASATLKDFNFFKQKN